MVGKAGRMSENRWDMLYQNCDEALDLGIEAWKAIGADIWVIAEASAMWQNGDLKEWLDRFCGRQKEKNGKCGKEVFGRVEDGVQRGYYAAEEHRGDNSFQSILHDIQSWEQVAQNFGMQEVKYSNSQITILNVGCYYSCTDYQIRRLHYSTGSGKGLSSFESERGLTEVHGIQVQRKRVLLRRLTFWLESESIAILYDNEINSQGNQGEVQRESGTIHGRPTDLIIGKETTGMRYGLDNLIHKGAGLEDVISQVQGNINEGLSIPWLEVENLYDGSMHPIVQEMIIEIEIEKMVRHQYGEEDNRDQEVSTITGLFELSEIAGKGCNSTYGVDQSNKTRSVEETMVEWQVEIGQEIFGRFEMEGLDNQGEQSKDVRFEKTCIQYNEGCGDNRMGGGIGGNGEGDGIGGESQKVELDLEHEVIKLMRNSSSANGTKINEKILSELDFNDRQQGQRGNGVVHQEMESQRPTLQL
ncbi:MAG: hypothetical protein EZS28_032152, partial [Streblomastix strix]